MASIVPQLKFNNGLEVPIFGLGTWKSKPGEVSQAVQDAIDIGYRHFDCAHVYGNEKEVGEAINAKINSGAVKREDLFVTSKLWNTFHRPDLVEGAVKETLNNLSLTYLDLYLIHWPIGYKVYRVFQYYKSISWVCEFLKLFTKNSFYLKRLTCNEDGEMFPVDKDGKTQFSDVDYVDTWKAMEALVAKKLVKSIGVSNFNSKQIQRILDVAKIKPVNNQVECHPYLNQVKLIDFCKSKDITVTAYSPLGSPDRPWAKEGEPKLLEDPKLVKLAEKYKKSVAQILLKYQVQRGVITIPKSVTKSRIRENFEIFDFTLADEDIGYINTLDCNGRFCPMTPSLGHEHHPFENTEF